MNRCRTPYAVCRGLNATIFRDGQSVVFVLDDANGGSIRTDFKNPLQNAPLYEANKHTDKTLG